MAHFAILRGRSACTRIMAVALSGAALLPQPALSEPAPKASTWPVDVAARYRLSFNSFDVGSYNFESRFDGKSYVAQSNANVSALFGAFRWKGAIQSSGAIQKETPRPTQYQLSYRSKSKQVSITLGFGADGVKSVSIVPPKPPHPEAVPLKAEHYKSVFDPMSAILAISHPASANPCDRKIPIFDGKARFDLVMSFKGQKKIDEKSASGQPQQLYVCRVKYVPIAGHKPKDFDDPWVDYNGIEIALRPVPSAGIFVPYRISIPTTIGAAEMTAESVTITGADREQIALKQ